MSLTSEAFITPINPLLKDEQKKITDKETMMLMSSPHVKDSAKMKYEIQLTKNMIQKFYSIEIKNLNNECQKRSDKVDKIGSRALENPQVSLDAVIASLREIQGKIKIDLDRRNENLRFNSYQMALLFILIAFGVFVRDFFIEAQSYSNAFEGKAIVSRFSQCSKSSESYMNEYFQQTLERAILGNTLYSEILEKKLNHTMHEAEVVLGIYDNLCKEINESQDINEMVQLFTEGITESLDEIAPFKTVTIWSNYNFGLSLNS